MIFHLFIKACTNTSCKYVLLGDIFFIYLYQSSNFAYTIVFKSFKKSSIIFLCSTSINLPLLFSIIFKCNINADYHFLLCDKVAEWLRRWTANPLGSARVGSNPILVGYFSFLMFCCFSFS